MDWNLGKSLLIASLALSTAVSHAKLSEDTDVFSVASAVNGPSNDYREVSDLALKILQKYPATEYQYVGVGRGPTPVIAALQAILGESAAINIPISKLTYVGRMDDMDKEFDLNAYLQRNAGVHQLLDKMMPSEKELGNRKILVIDFVKDPKDIIQSKSLFHDFAFERNKQDSREVTVLAIGRKASAYIALNQEGIETINVPTALHERLSAKLYYEMAEYAPIDFSQPQTSFGTLQKRQEFADLRNAYIERMRADMPFLIDLIALNTKGMPVVKGISRQLLAKFPPRSSERGRALEKCVQLLAGLID